MKTEQSFRTSVIFCALILFAVVAGGGEDSPFRYPPSLKNLNRAILRDEVADFRHLIFDRVDLYRRISQGSIYVARGHGLDRATFEEHSTNSWKIVQDACRDLHVLGRVGPKSQIRIVKHDEIIQSTVEPFGYVGNGLTSEFLRTPLEAGDVIVFTQTFD